MNELHARFLTVDDIPALLALESAKWDANQAACAEMLKRRIAAHPMLCVGAFCAHSGRALASLFLRPVAPAIFTAPLQWMDCAAMDGASDNTGSLFGVSLSSTKPQAVEAIFAFIYPYLLKGGWREIYLGSPIPGLRKALQRNVALPVWQYVHAKRRGCSDEPADPQLAYYYRKGFRQIVSIHENYFPHAASLDYGVILRGPIPLARPGMLWRATPLPLLKGLARVLMSASRTYASCTLRVSAALTGLRITANSETP
nr:hypothetical protein [uncultured Pseudomonas sp.]